MCLAGGVELGVERQQRVQALLQRVLLLLQVQLLHARGATVGGHRGHGAQRGERPRARQQRRRALQRHQLVQAQLASLTEYFVNGKKILCEPKNISAVLQWCTCSVARMPCTVLMAEVVGEVLAPRSLGLLLAARSWPRQLGLLGTSDSHEQFGEHGAS